ncbi:MAG: branched-chain amino acid ABC transporter permease [Paracoccaceae bacterium]|nr:branched-chain amino acid ABC transporter permease [Paracoccaceae bacterium]MDE2913778.1 branched-chain amino acid ABC transporter permease [Paracoccaceae bacterium]
MIDFIQTTLDGLSIGSAYALIALGFTLVFGVMRRINLSYGPSIMLGAFAGTWAFVTLEAQPWLVAVVTIAGTVAVGMYVERLCFWAIRKDAAIASMVSSFVIWMQLEEVATILLPGRTYPYPELFKFGGIDIGPYFLRMEHVTTLAVAMFMLVVLRLLLYRTRFGLALRAVSESSEAAVYMGISPVRITFWAFVFASFIGGVAGYLLLAADQQVTPYFGLWATFKGLIAMMLGGLGSIPGAIVGGLLLGVIEAHTQWYLGNAVKDLTAYLVLFLVLVLRPGGLLGQGIVERHAQAFRRI